MGKGIYRGRRTITPITEVKRTKLRSVFLLSFSGVILFFASFNKPENCKRYFPGKWKYEDMPTTTIYVIRTNKKQFEYTQDGKYYYEYDLKWLSKCRYRMCLVKTTDPNPAVARKGDSLIVEILNIQKDQMKYSTIYRNQEETGNMKRIN